MARPPVTVSPYTTALARTAIEDDSTQSDLARSLFEAAAQVAAIVPALCERVWVLSRAIIARLDIIWRLDHGLAADVHAARRRIVSHAEG